MTPNLMDQGQLMQLIESLLTQPMDEPTEVRLRGAINIPPVNLGEADDVMVMIQQLIQGGGMGMGMGGGQGGGMGGMNVATDPTT